MKALNNKNKLTNINRLVSDKKSNLKKTTIQNQLKNRCSGQYKNGSFNLALSNVYSKIFGDLMIDWETFNTKAHKRKILQFVRFYVGFNPCKYPDLFLLIHENKIINADLAQKPSTVQRIYLSKPNWTCPLQA